MQNYGRKKGQKNGIQSKQWASIIGEPDTILYSRLPYWFFAFHLMWNALNKSVSLNTYWLLDSACSYWVRILTDFWFSSDQLPVHMLWTQWVGFKCFYLCLSMYILGIKDWLLALFIYLLDGDIFLAVNLCTCSNGASRICILSEYLCDVALKYIYFFNP